MGDGERPIEVDRSPRGLDRLSISIQIQQEHGPQVMQLARERVPLRRRGADALGLHHVLVSPTSALVARIPQKNQALRVFSVTIQISSINKPKCTN